MSSIPLENLGLLFVLFGIIIVVYTLSFIKSNKMLQTIVPINIFYSIIYGFAPGIICLYVAKYGARGFQLSYINFNQNGIETIWYFFYSAILGILGINIGHKIKINKKINTKKIIIQSPNRVKLAAIYLMVIGWAGLLLWTKAFGGPIGILPYANALRAGRDIGLENPWSFMMKLCPFMQFAAYIFWSHYLTDYKVSDLLMFLFSSVGTFLYILANSSRMHFVLFFIILLVLYMSHYKMTIKKYIVFAFVGLLGLSIMHSAENLLNYFQSNRIASTSISFNVAKILRDEFFFPMASFQTCVDAIVNEKIGIRFFEDIIHSIFAWLPSKFTPSSFKNLEVVNTLLHSGTMAYGGLPPDFITTCLYELNVLGLFILPIAYGYLVKRFELTVSPLFANDYYKVIYILGSFYFVKAIGYGDFSNIMSNIFFLVWGHLFTLFICMIKVKQYGLTWSSFFVTPFNLFSTCISFFPWS